MVDMVEIMFTSYVAVLFCGVVCFFAPSASNLVMRHKRAAHKAWFARGAAEFGTTGDKGSKWAKELPRLIADRAISYEDATHAAGLGVIAQPKPMQLLSSVNLDATFTIDRKAQWQLAFTCGVVAFCSSGALTLRGTPIAHIICFGCILAMCISLDLVDSHCRMIPDITVAALCVLGALLCLASAQYTELLMLAALAVAVMGCMYAADAFYMHRPGGHHAFGNGDKKVMGAVVLCSGAQGLLPAFAVLIAALGITLIVACIRGTHNQKIAFGSYAAPAIIVGSITSILM